MSKEPIYRIKIEVIGEEKEGEKIEGAPLEGIECDQFVILSETEDSRSVLLHRVNTIDIAHMICHNGTLMAASFIAKAIHDGSEYIAKEKSKKSLKNFADLLKGKHE